MPKVLLLSRQPLATRPLHDWLDHTADDIVLVTMPKAVTGAQDVLAEHFPQHLIVDDYHSWSAERAAEQAARSHGVDLVASSSENDVLRAARLRARLGLPGQGVASATAYRDKVVMKQLVAAAGIAVPAFAPLDSPADLLDFVEAEGYPVVVKPRFGAGAAGVSVLRGPQDVTDFLAGERTSDVPYLPGQWMAESFVSGDFFHIDGIMRDGRVVHAWPAQYTSGCAERIHDELHLGSVMLAADDERTAVLVRMAAEVVAALPAAPHPLAFHLEAWIDGADAPVLCEIASRAGGALIAQAYERAFGVQLAREGLRGQCGAELILTEQPATPAALVGWAMLPPGHGEFVPPAGTCPVPGTRFELLMEAGSEGKGVTHLLDSAASLFVEGPTADSARRRLMAAIDWWNENTAWK
ncbi:hypothetical protein AB0D46_27400 [Streptomyces sp. NPDC048383]|uniref:ATP-grasp domain-containing protein n=1 Tax=Streptomyces sp. NPDC048383 TaxID=3155386 RepID=UPI00341245FA